MEKIVIIGNLTRDPDYVVASNGGKVCRFSVATNRRNGLGEKITHYYHVTAWSRLGEICAKYLYKGRKVAVAGDPDLYVSMGKDGKPYGHFQIAAIDVEFLSPVDEGENPAAKSESKAVSASTPSYPSASTEDYEELEGEDLPF